MVISYLPGCDLYHKIALLNKEYRKILPKSGLLDQAIVITLKNLPDYSKIPMTSLFYAISLADSFQL